MTLIRRLLGLAVAGTYALGAFADGPAPTGLEQRLGEGLPYTLASAVLHREFTSREDHVFLVEAMRAVPRQGRLLFRAHARRADDVVTITSADGRRFDLGPPTADGSVVINDRAIAYRGRPLADFVRDTEAALRLSYVARHERPWAWLMPRAHATAPVFFVITIAALAIYQTYAGAAASPDPAAQAASRLADLARVCDAERESGFVAYPDSETARTVRELRPDDVVNIARLGGDACEAEVTRALDRSPKPSDLRILCGNAGHLARCVDTFRGVITR